MADGPGGSTGIATVSTMALPKIFNIDLEKKKTEILNKFYSKIGINPTTLTSEEKRMLLLGVTYGADDNLTFGISGWLTQKTTGKIPPEEDYYFMRAKTFTDAVFTSAYTVGAVGSAAEAARALSTAGLSGGMALATAPTGGGAIAFGGAAVAELAESAVMTGVSFVSAKLAQRSQNIFRFDMEKLRNTIGWKVSEYIKVKSLTTKSAEEANNWWLQRGYDKPPYKPGTKVYELELLEDKTFVRVWKEGTSSGQKGQWFMKAEDIRGLSPEQIAEKYALQHVPDRITELKLTANTKIRGGIANSVPDWGRAGGNIQFDLMGQITDGFVNPSNLIEWLANH